MGLQRTVDGFVDALLAMVTDKPAMVQLMFEACPALPRQRAALKYLGRDGVRQVPLG